mgnify:FL=1|jgi:hypothetical protein
MPDYQQGKIYKIWSPQSDKVYIGSTVQTLSKRMTEHRKPSRQMRTPSILIGLGDAKIELIELCPCNSKMELIRREGQIIRETNCINPEIPGRTKREYEIDNKEHIAEVKKEYREKNAEYLKQQLREYYQKNRSHALEQSKLYRAKAKLEKEQSLI